MGDYFTEQLVKRKKTSGTYLAAAALVAVNLAVLFLMMLFPLAFLLVIVVCFADYFLFQSLSVEYEYLYVNGSLDIDKILAKSRRKRAFSMEIGDLELIAPQGSPDLRPYQDLKAVDFSSHTPEAKVYEMIVVRNGAKQKVLFEPEAAILEGMRMYAPRKVIV